MSLYEFLLFLHIAGAIVWLGGGVMAQLYAYRALRSREGDRMAAITADIEWIGTRILVPTALATFLLGVGLVWEAAAIGFGDDWIVIALVLFALTFLAGTFYFGPESGRIARLISSHGSGSPLVQTRIRRILVLSRIDLVLLFLIVFDMTVKPSFGDGWTITWALVVAVALSLLLTVRPGAGTDAVAATD